MDTGGGSGNANSKSPESYDGLHLDHQHHHNHHLFERVRSIGLLFGIIIVTCYMLYPSAYPLKFSPHSSYNQDKGGVKLEKILEKVAMADKTVIITTLNGAWAAPNSIFDVFLESFRIGNETSRFLNHLVVIAVDHYAYDRCLALHPHCYALSTTGLDFSGEASYMTSTYLEIVWRKIDLLHSVLKMGYSFIFTDADIMWFRNPFLHFYLDDDFQTACDFFWGNTSDLENQANTGFLYVKSNERTIKLYKFWYTSRKTYPGLHDQHVLNKIKFDSFVTTNIGVKIRFLDTAYFGGFCQPSKDLNQVCTMHANCCMGLGSKVHELKVMLDNWRKFLSLPTDVRASQPTSWAEPKSCSIKSFRLPRSPKKKVQQGSNNGGS
ncbi:hypothetical protein ACSBR1_037172 [Camellia fascicularis]